MKIKDRPGFLGFAGAYFGRSCDKDAQEMTEMKIFITSKFQKSDVDYRN